MWCRSCQQDVPGITTGVVPRPKCARCGSPFFQGCIASPHFAEAGVLERGVDLLSIAAARPARDRVSLQADGDVRHRLREVDYLLKQEVPRWPRLRRQPLEGTRVGLAADEPAAVPMDRLRSIDQVEEPAIPQLGEPTSTFFWAALSAMLAFLLTIGLIWPELFEMAAARFH